VVDLCIIAEICGCIIVMKLCVVGQNLRESERETKKERGERMRKSEKEIERMRGRLPCESKTTSTETNMINLEARLIERLFAVPVVIALPCLHAVPTQHDGKENNGEQSRSHRNSPKKNEKRTTMKSMTLVKRKLFKDPSTRGI
jgi:hypothetical protein